MKKIFWLLYFAGITMLSAQPAIEWQKTFGGSSYDQAKEVCQTNDDGYILAGNTFSSNGDVSGYHGGWDYWVLKLANTGEIEWTKTLGGSLNDIAQAVQQTSDQGYFVAGYAASNNFDVTGHHGGLTDGWVVKLNANGAIQWQKAIGGSERDEIWDAQQTSDKGYILTGRSNSSDGDVSMNQGKYDVWVVKLNELGNVEWNKTFGGSEDDSSRSVEQTADGGYIIAGQTSSANGHITLNQGNVDFWVLKLSPTGDLEWQKTFGGENADIASDVIQASDGGYVVSGYVGSHNTGDVTGHQGSFDYWLLKLDETGELLWQKTIGGSQPDWGEAVVPDIGGGYVIAGSSYSNDGDVETNYGSEDFWLAKISETGDLVWQKSFGGSMSDECYALANTSDNGYVLAGLTWSNNGDIAGAGNQGQNDYWVVKLSAPAQSTSINLPTPPLTLFPNPAQNSITLQTHYPYLGATLQVSLYDQLGRIVLRLEVPNGGHLDISALQKGLYYISASDEDGAVYWGKLEKE